MLMSAMPGAAVVLSPVLVYAQLGSEPGSHSVTGFEAAAVASAIRVLGQSIEAINTSTLHSLTVSISESPELVHVVVPGKVCRKAPSLLPRDRASAVQVSRYEAQAKGPNGISEPYS